MLSDGGGGGGGGGIDLSVGSVVALRFTVLGKHMAAVGSNERTARLAGLQVGRVKVTTYALAGLLAGIAGIFQLSTLTVGDPTDSIGLELSVIASVVIGDGERQRQRQRQR